MEKMHQNEKVLIDRIASTLGNIGVDAGSTAINQAMGFTLAEMDPVFGIMLALCRGAVSPTICADFHGVRALIRVGAPITGLVTVTADAGRLVTFSLEFDVGWGRAGLSIDQSEQAGLLRKVFSHIAENFLSGHARLELMAELMETDGAMPLQNVWSLLREVPDIAVIEAACLRIKGAIKG